MLAIREKRILVTVVFLEVTFTALCVGLEDIHSLHHLNTGHQPLQLQAGDAADVKSKAVEHLRLQDDDDDFLDEAEAMNDKTAEVYSIDGDIEMINSTKNVWEGVTQHSENSSEHSENSSDEAVILKTSSTNETLKWINKETNLESNNRNKSDMNKSASNRKNKIHKLWDAGTAEMEVDVYNNSKTELLKNVKWFNKPEAEEGSSRVLEDEASGEGEQEGLLSQIKQHKLVNSHESFSTSLLMDIRDTLRQDQHTKCDHTSIDSLERRLDHLRDEKEDAIGRLSSNVNRLEETMNQKINLVLETFSMLKLLVASQGDQLTVLQEKLQGVQEQTHTFEVQMNRFQRSLQEVESSLRSHKPQVVLNYSDILTEESIQESQLNITEIDDRIQETKSSLDDLTEIVKNLTGTVKSVRDEVKEVKINITERTEVLAATLSKEPTSDKHNTVDASTTCQCFSNELRNSLAKLEKVQNEQKSELDGLARNLTTLESERREVGNKSWSYNHRLGEVESFKDLSFVKRKVNAVQEELHNLKQEMGSKTTLTPQLSNVTIEDSSVEGICVWPYRRGGGGCYHVNREERLTWQSAREHCRSIQGDLAAPQQYNQFKVFILKLRLSRAYTYWIGASNVGKEGVWSWIDGRVVSEDVWGGTQPEDLHSHCMALKPAYKFVASAEGCRESRFFICQQERLL
nr:C-type lectin domain family 4 member F-like [Procambarus clarkii]